MVIDVASDGRVGALRQQAANNPACPYAKNLVAEEFKGIVDAYRANPLQYVVLVGNDDAIPFFRSPDKSAIGKESGYVPPVESNSPSEASLRRDFVLSQDRYGSKTSIALPWNDFPVPELAVGRLVETRERDRRVDRRLCRDQCGGGPAHLAGHRLRLPRGCGERGQERARCGHRERPGTR